MKILKALNITSSRVIFNALFFIGALLTVWELEIYENTFIDYRIPTLLWIGPGLCLTPVLRKTLAFHMNTSSLLLQLIYNVVTWGGIIVFTFMATNFYFTEQNTWQHTLKIKSNGSLAGGGGGRCRIPYVVVDWMGNEKQIEFPCGTALAQADSIKVDLKKGLLGYEVIVDKELMFEK
jgi:hypothetical protein